MIEIPFNKVIKTGNELDCIQDAINAMHISGDGLYTKKCHDFLESFLNVKKVLLTSSCTHALEMTAILLDIKEGDEVIVPSFTFVSTANAFAMRGAKIVFADIRPDTLNIDEKLLRNLITKKTKAIVPVHYAGVGCEMDEIMTISSEYAIPVVEDNAHGLFGKYKGRYLGTFGCMATQSFHETKNITCGEGGALLINDDKFIDRAEIIREKGTDRSRFFRGQVDKYSWVDIGSSYLPSDILAAFLYAQLESWEAIQKKRKEIWTFYDEHLKEWAVANKIKTPYIPAHCEHPAHIYYLIMNSLEERKSFIDYMNSQRINCVFHYLPLNTSKMGINLGAGHGACPVSESISDKLVRLPLFTALSDLETGYIVNVIKNFFKR